MHISVRKYIINTVHLLHVSATHVTILSEVHYKGLIDRNITEVFETMQGYNILKFKIVQGLKYIHIYPSLDGDLLHTCYPLHIRINHKYFILILTLICI
jgi:hypothetical protein